MRCSGWSSLAISAYSALVLAAPAAAHIEIVPPFLAAGDTTSVSFTGPNERGEPMTGFAVTVPDGFAIAHAHEADGWQESVEGRTALWTGGSLAPDAEATFGIDLETAEVPGAAELVVEQRYPAGLVTRWDVPLTVTPPAEGHNQNLALAAVVGALGLAIVAAIAALTWRRRTGTLQER